MPEVDPANSSKRLGDFKTSEVHIDTSGISIRFVKPGTPLRQNDPKRNTQAGRDDFKAKHVQILVNKMNSTE
ncbi:hypothetical protein FRC01_005290, partial [Tulasnella sp. 417]